VIGAVTLNKHSRNLDTWSGDVQFYCEPFKELLRSPDVEVLLSNGTYTNNVIRNNGDAKCYPLIHLTVDGSSTVTMTVGGKTLTMTGMGSSGARYWIDSETQQLLNNGLASNFTYRTSGDFPVFAQGNNTITGSGWTKLVISKRERYI
jgi:phage-related protein